MSDLCKLCQTNKLENVGSHIFTESIIRTALNEDGFTKREDKELIYEISTENIGLDYFGNGVLPEKLQQILGREASEDEIKKNKNPFINRDLVCRDCEKKFGPIETSFAQDIYAKIIKKKDEELESDSCNYVSFANQKTLGLQFSIINIWRASASKYDNWSLKEDDEEYLRKFILKTADLDIQSIIKKTQENLEEIERFDFALNYFISSGNQLSDNGVLIDNSAEPFFILLNRLSIIFDFKILDSKKMPDLTKGTIESNIGCIISSNLDDELRIGINTDEERKKLFNKIALIQLEQIRQKFTDTFFQLHRAFFGFFPSQEAINYFNQKMIEYIKSRDGEIIISEMLNVVTNVIMDCGRSYV
ncbi:hypothetical protein SAMN05444483_102334 [Salegentibacter echinorum]|uniref:Uncharacterized protein n=1 Tax=Salegentibacter echinorum TaxID=1073325 RepID=A0A1M5EDP5_SALEC|nr:hypothetical protein [Salegentibacter echinorum]SHF77335.1 hypothetical protein SAMN05444483_102334 [Salegentibacter echinorum]